ncbi:Ankyrin repeat domain-containing protein 26 [Fukomys damarensis]|uniref:Ankyrin repeat domain-containing protein 26 n=1 Tax=Fukomys damarensis TaxID=885580 RepID=A0A091CM97_FUKDA|nr:Ankyrin repeat domain-containing protein 26 [Fukomys damarensis]
MTQKKQHFIQQSGKTDNQQFPIKKNEEHDSGPAFPVGEVKKKESEQWSSTESMTACVGAGRFPFWWPTTSEGTIKLNEDTTFQCNGQLSSLTIENTILNSKLENEKQIKERLEAEIESYHPRLAAALQDYDEIQTSKKDVELAFQRAREEWVLLEETLNFDISNLKDNNEMLSQQLS